MSSFVGARAQLPPFRDGALKNGHRRVTLLFNRWPRNIIATYRKGARAAICRHDATGAARRSVFIHCFPFSAFPLPG